MTESPNNWIVVYASQTGNAEWIAKNIASSPVCDSFPPLKCLCADEYTEAVLNLMKCQANFIKLHASYIPLKPAFVFVSSTTGDGDAPDNALKFWRMVRKLTKVSPTPFEGVKFTVLGLGDTNYSQFGAHPKKIEKKMLEMGAQLFYPRLVADEVEGLEAQVDPWIEGLWPALRKLWDSTSVAAVEEIEKVTVEMNDVKLEPATHEFVKLSLPWVELENESANLTLTSLPRSPAALVKVDYTGNQRPRRTLIEFSKTTHYSTGSEIGLVEYDETSEKQAPLRFASLESASCLTTTTAVKRTLCVTLGLNELKWAYRPGDAVGVLCENYDAMATSVIERLGLVADQEFQVSSTDETIPVPTHLTPTMTVDELFRYVLDLQAPPRKAFFKLLTDHCVSDVAQKKMLMFLSSKQGSAVLRAVLEWKPTMLDWLVTFPDARIPLNRLLDVALPLAPRYYSISSSAVDSPEQIRIGFNVIKYSVSMDGATLPPVGNGKPLIEHHKAIETHLSGVCTPWLDSLLKNPPAPEIIGRHTTVTPAEPIYIPIVPRPQRDFRLPSKSSIPIIMIGPGTGVTPFMGFCAERVHSQKSSSENKGELTNWLIYGCRDGNKDWLFRNEMQALEVLGQARVSVCFSRQKEKSDGCRYVQDLMRKHGSELAQWMCDRKAVFYVCGDAKGMAKDVHQALVDVVGEYKKCTVVEANETVAVWMKEKRYLRDVWG